MEEKTKQKRDGSGVGDIVEMNLNVSSSGGVKNVSGKLYFVVYSMFLRLFGVTVWSRQSILLH